MLKKITTYLFLMHIVLGLNAQKPTGKDIIGTWERKYTTNGSSCVQSYVFKPNGKTQVIVFCENNSQNSRSTMGSYYYKEKDKYLTILAEVINGQVYNGQINWVNIDSFFYTPIGNNGIPVGERVYYKRIKAIDVANYSKNVFDGEAFFYNKNSTEKTEKSVNIRRTINVIIDPNVNFSIEATFYSKKLKLFAPPTFGLIYGSSKSNANLFKISRGHFTTASIYEDNLMDSVNWDSIPNFNYNKNVLKLTKLGNLTRYYINGNLVKQKKDIPIFGNLVGFEVGNNEEIEISNFIIIEFLPKGKEYDRPIEEENTRVVDTPIFTQPPLNRAEKRLALILGNAKYDNTELNLTNPTNDADKDMIPSNMDRPCFVTK